MCLMCPYAFYNEVLWVPFAPKWGQAECCKSHEWKELIPVSLVHTIIYILMCLMCPYAFYNEVLWVPFAPKWGQAECCKSHEWKELIPVSLVHTIIPNKTQGLFSNLAYFRAKYRLLMAAMFVAGCILIGQSFWT